MIIVIITILWDPNYLNIIVFPYFYSKMNFNEFSHFLKNYFKAVILDISAENHELEFVSWRELD